MLHAFDIRYVGTRLNVPSVKFHRCIVAKKRKLLAVQGLEEREGHSIEVLTINYVGPYPCKKE